MKWSERYATGFEEIDRQHRMLFQMCRDFSTALEEGTGERTYAVLLRSLELYAQAHFGTEESCMAECNCPSLEQNQREHEEFSATLDAHQQRFAAHGYEIDRANALRDSLRAFLRGHILRVDIQLRGCHTDS